MRDGKRLMICLQEFFVPVHVALEVTAHCNARCKHCYGAFAVKREHVLDTDDVIRLLEQLRNVGVRTIELTGGECTTHPNFPEIFEKCVSIFDLVAVLTNGISIHEKVFEIAESHPWNITVQICINGKKEYHDYFVAFNGEFDLASNSIRKFAERGIMVRSPMNLTEANWKDMEYQ
jgi:MoaA/NifB/PqqE/SkfB family radical SAM enzyme